jgi:hypothetical protein
MLHHHRDGGGCAGAYQRDRGRMRPVGHLMTAAAMRRFRQLIILLILLFLSGGFGLASMPTLATINSKSWHNRQLQNDNNESE